MILVDTSVWLDFLVGRNTPFRHELHRLIEGGADIVLTGIIFQEILQGIRSDVDCRRTEKYLREFHYISLSEPDVFRQAAEVYRICAQKGKKIRKSIDCLIAAQSLQANAELFHNDRDFIHISQIFPLKIYRIPT